MHPLSEHLRIAIRNAGVSCYQISKLTGVSQSSLSKFLNYERPGLSFDAMDKIGEYLGLMIVEEAKYRAAKRRARPSPATRMLLQALAATSNSKKPAKRRK